METFADRPIIAIEIFNRVDGDWLISFTRVGSKTYASTVIIGDDRQAIRVIRCVMGDGFGRLPEFLKLTRWVYYPQRRDRARVIEWS